MVSVDDYPPLDAVVSLGPGRKAVDIVKYILGVIREDWEPSNVNGTTPVVEFSESMKAVRFSSGDFITLYTLSQTTEPVSLVYDFVNETITFSIDMFTSVSREHLIKLYEEVRRAILKHRRDTIPISEGLTGRMWMEWEIRSSPFEKTGKNFYRRTVDCRVNWRYRHIKIE